MFTALQGSVLLRANGSYSEAKIFSLDEVVHAKKHGAYIKLMDAGRTSLGKTFWSRLTINHHLTYPMGVMTLSKVMIEDLHKDRAA